MHRLGMGYGSERRVAWERSPFCAKSLSAVWGPHVELDCLPAWARDPSSCLSLRVPWTSAGRVLVGRLETLLGFPKLPSWDVVCFQTGGNMEAL